MSSLVILQPHRPTATGSSSVSAGAYDPAGVDMRRLLSPDPKEAVQIPAGKEVVFFDFDFGGNVEVDSVYIGYCTSPLLMTGGIQQLTQLGAGDVLATFVFTDPVTAPGYDSPYHCFQSFPLMVGRYFRIGLSVNGAQPTIGTMQMGVGFQPEFGREYGSGRTITDTSTVDRLFGGGFGIDYGVTAGGFQWTMGDLTDAEVSRLYRLARNRGVARSLLVVEDPDQTEGLNERIHWGLFQRFEKFERFAPGATRWSMAIEDWA